MAEIPEPLTPPDCDLRGFENLQLDVDLLPKSKLANYADAEAFRAAVLLWCEAWKQVPAASLPDDDLELRAIVGLQRDPDLWERIKTDALSKFIKCSDGRLYHTVLSEKACKAWKSRIEYRARAKAGGKASAAARAKADGQPPSSPHAQPPGSPQVNEGEGEGEGEGDINKQDACLLRRASAPTPRAILESVLDPEDAEAVLDHRKKLRKPMTERAAKLLVGELVRCRDGPKAGAEMMILRGWLSFKADWYENDRTRNDQRNGKAPGVVDDLRAVIDRAKDFDRAGREPVPGDEPEPRRRALGFG